MKSKKGVIEVEFNWIFILVAGALILLFFVVLVQRQGEVSEQKMDVNIKSKLQAILTSAKQSTGTFFSINIPNTKIEFDCEGYSVGTTKKFQLGESFSPTLIKSRSRELFLWALDWSVPYKIANFQYIVTPDIQYVVVNDEDLYNLLPENITKDYVIETEIGESEENGGLTDRNSYRVRFVIFEELTNDLISNIPDFIMSNMPDEDVTAVVVNRDHISCPYIIPEVYDTCGNVTFYQKSGAGFEALGTYPFLKKESLLGAIFTDSNETYDCVMRRAMKKLELASAIYYNRTRNLYDFYIGDNSVYCNRFGEYNDASTRIGEIIDNSIGFSFQNVTNIFDNSYKKLRSLQKLNRLLQLNSCPLLY